MMTNIDMSNNSPRNCLIRIYGMIYILTVHVHMQRWVYWGKVSLVDTVHSYVYSCTTCEYKHIHNSVCM